MIAWWRSRKAKKRLGVEWRAALGALRFCCCCFCAAKSGRNFCVTLGTDFMCWQRGKSATPPRVGGWVGPFSPFFIVQRIALLTRVPPAPVNSAPTL